MTEVKEILQTLSFKKAAKKLKPDQKKALDKAIKALVREPYLGEQKKGDLAFLRVYKFKISKQTTLLGYSFDDGQLILTLMALGSHENFYRDIKNR